MMNVDILHKYDAKQYYQPLLQGETRGLFSDVNFYNYSLRHNPRKITQNISYLSKLLVSSKEKNIILGAEPFDIKVPLFTRIAERHNVIYHTSWPYWSGSDVPKKSRFKIQQSSWDNFLSKVAPVTVSKAAKRELNTMGYEAVHIPHGVRTDVFEPKETGQSSDHKVRILFVGRLVEEKGIFDLMKVIKNIDSSKVLFQFVGKGPLAEKIQDVEKHYPVEYLGYISNREQLANIYANSDIFVLPSFRYKGWEELFGIVLIEAMASGLPIVTTDSVGPREIVQDGKTGYIVGQRSSEQISEALNKLIDNPSRRELFGSNARKIAVQKYNMDLIADKWQQKIHDVI